MSFSASLLLAILIPVGAPQDIPEPNWVVDDAGVVDAATEEQLTGFILDLRKQTGAEMAVVTVRTTGGTDIFDYSFRIADTWKVGKAQQDTGVVLVVAVDDRKAHIQVGYGLEGALPDALVTRIGREHMAPHFKKGEYSQGILRGSLAILNIVAEEYGVTLTGLPSVPTRRGWSKTDSIGGGVCLVGFIILILFIGFIIRSTGGGRYHGSGWLWLLLFGSSYRGGYWGGHYGGRSGGIFGGAGGFGGGGFGGFGGGSFGGGGGGFSW
jgi:uncharacterized protein